MKDFLLTRDGDLYISETGDIAITDSARQAIEIRLLWFLGEWKFGPAFGIPYYEDIMIKNPNKLQVEQIIREQIMSVDEIQEVSELTVKINSYTRTMRVSFTALVNGETLREEMVFSV